MHLYEYLIGVGAMKAGTTLLYDLLRKHPGFLCGQHKELHYFDQVDQPDKGEYDALFAPGQGVKLDVTPIYMYDPQCIRKICQVLDPAQVAVAVVLRDPVERALSHWRMCLSQAQKSIPLRRASIWSPSASPKTPTTKRPSAISAGACTSPNWTTCTSTSRRRTSGYSSSRIS